MFSRLFTLNIPQYFLDFAYVVEILNLHAPYVGLDLCNIYNIEHKQLGQIVQIP